MSESEDQAQNRGYLIYTAGDERTETRDIIYKVYKKNKQFANNNISLTWAQSQKRLQHSPKHPWTHTSE